MNSFRLSVYMCFYNEHSYLNTEERYHHEILHASDYAIVLVTTFQNDIIINFKIAALKLHF